jgi:cytochrome c5
MRKRLKNFLPIILIALVVQIFAPIGACWAASIAASDPLAAAVICHGSANAATGQSDPTGHRAHDGCCSVCSVLHTGAPVDVPQIAQAISFERRQSSIVWVAYTPDRFGARAGSHAQARAPPSIS